MKKVLLFLCLFSGCSVCSEYPISDCEKVLDVCEKGVAVLQDKLKDCGVEADENLTVL